MLVSYGTNLYNPIIKRVEFEKIIGMIRGDTVLKKKIEQIQKTDDKKERNKLKQNLPFFNMGEFKEVLTNENFISTEYILFDYDDLPSAKEIVALRANLEADKWILAVFTSPSGFGLKVVAKLPKKIEDPEEYLVQWIYYSRLMEEKYGLKNDTQCKDVRRLCFLSHDPAASFNPYANPLPSASEPELDEIRAQYRSLGPSGKSSGSDVSASGGFSPGPQTDSTSKNCHRNNPPSFEEIEDACNFIAGKINDTETWVKIGVGLANELGERGRQLFLDISLRNPNYNDSENFLNSRYTYFMRQPKRSSIESVFFTAHQMGWKPQKYTNPIDESDVPISADDPTKQEDRKFWYFKFGKTASADKMTIPPVSFITFLSSKGFGKFWWDDARYVLIRVQNNIVFEMTGARIKDFMAAYTKKLPDPVETIFNEDRDAHRIIKKAEIFEGLMNSRLFNDDKLEFLPPVEVDFLRDEKHLSRLFYKNCYMEVTLEHIWIRDYSNLKRKIWKSQRINREINKTKFDQAMKMKESNSEFGQFCRNITGGDGDRYKALVSGIGYMLHTHKNRAKAKCLVLMDEQLSAEEEANGRTGKSLLGSGISKMRSFKRLDGRNFDFRDKFRFQEVRLSDEIVDFNDAQKRFDFGRLFSVITDDMSIERKGASSITIPFEKSPKFMISTNFVINNMDNSSSNRQFVIELSNHYNPDNTPLQEFGHLLFDEWDEDEWMAFDVFMMQCIRFYLRHGLYNYAQVNVAEKNLILSTSQDFVQTCDDLLASNQLMLDVFYAKTDMMEKIKMSSGYEKIGPIKIGKWFVKWAKARGFEYEEVRRDQPTPDDERNQVRGFTISKPDKSDTPMKV